VKLPLHEEQRDVVAVARFKYPGKLRFLFGKNNHVVFTIPVSQRHRSREFEELLDALRAVVRSNEFIEDPLDESADALLLPLAHETICGIHRITSFV